MIEAQEPQQGEPVKTVYKDGILHYPNCPCIGKFIVACQCLLIYY